MTVQQKVIVIGAGIAGVNTAKKLGDLGYQVILIEQKKKILEGSSHNTPCRLGLGFHYNDLETAIRYLHATFDFLKENPNFTVADSVKEREKGKDPQADDSRHKYLQTWQYFFVNNSFYNYADVAKDVYDKLRDEYIRLSKIHHGDDVRNWILGHPDDFYKMLTVGQYIDSVNPNVVSVGIQTAEQVLDWPKYKQNISAQIEQHEKITLLTGTTVVDLKRHEKSPLYTVKTDTGQTIEAPFVVNATWQNIEAVNRFVGEHYPPDSRSNRLKGIVEIDLTKHELTKKLINSPSKFFCFGAHCSFTNTGNGKGFLSFEPVTNIEQSTAIELPELTQKLLDNKLTEAEWRDYVAAFGKRILDGAANYIPGIEHAEIIGAKFGVVRIPSSDVNIYSPDSAIHKRNESGVEETNLEGLIVNGAAKLLYGFKNADEVVAIIEKQSKIIDANGTLLKENSLARRFNNATFSQVIKPVYQATTLSLEDFVVTLEDTLPVKEASEWRRKAKETGNIDISALKATSPAYTAQNLWKKYSEQLKAAGINRWEDIYVLLPEDIRNLTAEKISIINLQQIPSQQPLLGANKLLVLATLSLAERTREATEYIVGVLRSYSEDPTQLNLKKLQSYFPKLAQKLELAHAGSKFDDLEPAQRMAELTTLLRACSPKQLKDLLPDYFKKLDIESLKYKYAAVSQLLKDQEATQAQNTVELAKYSPDKLKALFPNQLEDYSLGRLGKLSPRERVIIIRNRLEEKIPKALRYIQHNKLISAIDANLTIKHEFRNELVGPLNNVPFDIVDVKEERESTITSTTSASKLQDVGKRASDPALPKVVNGGGSSSSTKSATTAIGSLISAFEAKSSAAPIAINASRPAAASAPLRATKSNSPPKAILLAARHKKTHSGSEIPSQFPAARAEDRNFRPSQFKRSSGQRLNYVLSPRYRPSPGSPGSKSSDSDDDRSTSPHHQHPHKGHRR